jgi:hypothetical protein
LNKREKADLLPILDLIPSPPRQDGGGTEEGEFAASHLSAMRTLAEEEPLPPLPDLTAASAGLFLSSPPRPAGGRRQRRGTAREGKQHATELFKGEPALSAALCSDHRSQRRRKENPRAQIWPLRSEHLHLGRRPKLRTEENLAATRTPAPPLRLPPPATPARLASVRAEPPVGRLRNCSEERESGGGKICKTKVGRLFRRNLKTIA